uniref:Uncharacterized protein n=1 Tax=Arundo donax TaxID=35708 RepID=A0A0A8ZSG0_ARUDO
MNFNKHNTYLETILEVTPVKLYYSNDGEFVLVK